MLPDFFIVGAPKAGTTALHNALVRHPQVHMARIKEPKHFLCDGTPPQPQRGPGDAHSVKEWVWRRDQYEALFEGAAPGAVLGESTPFYLYDRAAHIRIAEAVPNAKLIVIVRDPVDRAYSNWMHAWSDGLEPIDDFFDACWAEPDRIADGWAPFWHYCRVGRYGEQLEHLYRYFPARQVHVLRYKELIDTPLEALDSIAHFLGIERGVVGDIRPQNSRKFVVASAGNRALASTIRAGATAGAHLPPKVWRAVSVPLVWSLQRNGTIRPKLDVDDRRALVGYFADDIRLLEELTGRSFNSWFGDEGRGEFALRVSVAQ